MPIPDHIQDALAAEALEKAAQRGLPRQGPGNVMPFPAADPRLSPDDRLARLNMAADIVGSAIEARDKADQAVRAAIRMFIGVYAEAIASALPSVTPGGIGSSPEAASSAMERLRAQTRPKTFGTKVDDDRVTQSTTMSEEKA